MTVATYSNWMREKEASRLLFMKRALAVTVLLAALMPTFSAATDNAVFECKPDDNALDCYLNTIHAAMLICPIEGQDDIVKIQISGRVSFSNSDTCVKQASLALDKQFTAAKVIFVANPKGLEMLKDHYAAWLAAADALIPGNESRVRYSARQDAIASRLNEMGKRLKLEK
jgi:hypothetical protein